MPSPKIVLYFTPDTEEIGRIPMSRIKFETTKNFETTRGKYKISFNNPCFLEATCESRKKAILSKATLTFKNTCFGELTKYIFKTSDYFEIWDLADPDDEWCFFRGMVNQVAKNQEGQKKTISLMLENACGYALGDNSIYYLHPLIIAKGQAPTNFFNPIKTLYGWIDGSGNATEKFESLEIDRIKSPSKLLETLVDKIANVRIELLRKTFYDNSEAIKSIAFYTGSEVEKNNIFIADRMSEMEGSILKVLQQYQGDPFCELFMIETRYRSVIRWRNTRWRDYNEDFCMMGYQGEAENLVTLYTDPTQYSSTKKSIYSQTGDYKFEKFFSGIINEKSNETIQDAVNAIFLYPATMDVKNNVPAMVIAQTRYDQDGAKKILNLNSIIRHGYRPITIRLPFIPQYMDAEAFSNTAKGNRDKVNDANYTNVGRFLSEYTEYASAMYKNIQNASNGQDVFQNNLHVTIADDYRIIRNKSDKEFFINVHGITWNFNATNPTTVFEWDRGFERETVIDSFKTEYQYV